MCTQHVLPDKENIILFIISLSGGKTECELFISILCIGLRSNSMNQMWSEINY